MEAFVIFVLFAAVVVLLVRQSLLSGRVRAMEEAWRRAQRSSPMAAIAPPAQERVASYPPPPSAAPAPVAAKVVEVAPGVPYRALYIPPPPVVEAPRVVAEPVVRESLEAKLGQSWLNRLGIITLVVGIALLLGRELVLFGALGRVLTGVALAALLLGGGLWLERRENYRVFARAGIGGGWALTFFLAFAVQHVDALRLIDSQLVDLVLMFVVAAAMVAHSLRYRSQVVTTLAFFLAFLTIGISEVTVFSLVAGAVLAAALAVIVARQRWFVLGLAGVVGVYVNHYLWLQRVFPGAGHVFPEFTASAGLLLAYWMVFRAVYVLRAPEGDDEQAVSALAAVLNSAGLLALLHYQSQHPEWAFWALLVLGVVEFVLAFVARPKNRVGFVVLSSLATVYLLAAVPFRFSGASWVLFWLLQAEALVLVGLRMEERVLRRLGVLAGLVTALALLQSWLVRFGQGTLPAASGHMTVVMVTAAVVFWLNSEAAPLRWAAIVEEDFDRVTLGAMSCCAALFAAMVIWSEVPPAYIALAWAALGLVLLELGLRAKRGWLLRVEGYAFFAMSFARLFFNNFALSDVAHHNSLRVLTVLPLIAAYAWVYERTQRLAASEYEFDRVAGVVAVWLGLVAAAMLTYLELPSEWVFDGFALLAALLLTVALLVKRPLFVMQAYAVLVLATVRGLVVNFADSAPTGPNGVLLGFVHTRVFTVSLASVLLLAALPAAFALRRHMAASGAHEVQPLDLLRRPEQPFFFVPLLLITLLLAVELHGGGVTIGWSALGLLVFLFALAVGERSYRLSGLGLLLLGVAKLLAWDIWHASSGERTFALIAMGVALLLVSFLYSRFKETLLKLL
jgi:uncharacterized membrane protein